MEIITLLIAFGAFVCAYWSRNDKLESIVFALIGISLIFNACGYRLIFIIVATIAFVILGIEICKKVSNKIKSKVRRNHD